MCSKDDLELFLANPDSFVYPNAPFSLPGASLLPKKISEIDVKALFSKAVCNSWLLSCMSHPRG